MQLSPSETTQNGKLTERRAVSARGGTNSTTKPLAAAVDRNFRKVMTTRLKLARVLIAECQKIIQDPGMQSELIPLSPSPHVVSRKLRQATCTAKPMRGDPITDEWTKAQSRSTRRENTFSSYRRKTEKRLKFTNAVLRSGIDERDDKIEQNKIAYQKVVRDNLDLSTRKRSAEDEFAKNRMKYEDWASKQLIDKEREAIKNRTEIWRLTEQIKQLTKGDDDDEDQGFEQQATRKSSMASSISSKFKTFRRKNKTSKATEIDAE